MTPFRVLNGSDCLIICHDIVWVTGLHYTFDITQNEYINICLSLQTKADKGEREREKQEKATQKYALSNTQALSPSTTTLHNIPKLPHYPKSLVIHFLKSLEIGRNIMFVIPHILHNLVLLYDTTK